MHPHILIFEIISYLGYNLYALAYGLDPFQLAPLPSPADAFHCSRTFIFSARNTQSQGES